MASYANRWMWFALTIEIVIAVSGVPLSAKSCTGLDQAGYRALAAVSGPIGVEVDPWSDDARHAVEAFLVEADCFWDAAADTQRRQIATRTREWTRHILTLAVERFGAIPPSLRGRIAQTRLRSVSLPQTPQFSWPLANVVVTSPYGLRVDPMQPNRDALHRGLDLRAAVGTPVRAAGYGVVIDAGYRGALGRAVSIRHRSGYITRYAHLDRIKTHRRAFVTPETTIATVGATGRTTEAHLHFELHRDGEPIDPRSTLPEHSTDRVEMLHALHEERL